MTEEPTSFGEYLKQLRKAQALTQRELAEQTGCSPRLIQKLEREERRPSRQIAQLLAERLDIPEDQQEAFVQFARLGSQTSPTLTQEPETPFAPWRSPQDVFAGARQPHIGNLPQHASPFIGRVAEAESLLSLLQRSDARLVTLTGPPGIGKTRLALEAARRIAGDFPDGVHFVEMAPVSDPDLIVPTISYTLKLREIEGRLPFRTLQDYLANKGLLLVLDNFEQIVGAGAVVAELLAAAPNLKALVTSREALHLSMEHEFTVPPMPCCLTDGPGKVEKPQECESVLLFTQRAQAVRPDFTLTDDNLGVVAEVCRRLEGVPLAIELAAAHIRALPPQAILSRLARSLELLTGGTSDLPPRQQTLRDAIEWSYDLLDEGEKHLLRSVSVFTGGFTLEAAESVCNDFGSNAEAPIRNPKSEVASPQSPGVLNGLAALVDKSLLQREASAHGETRFRILETIREYAQERLLECGEASYFRGRHALYYLELAEIGEQRLRGPEQIAWLERLEKERANLQAALRWWQAAPTSAETLRLAVALLLFWVIRGHFTEGREYFRAALEHAGESGKPSMLRAKALYGIGALAYEQGDNGVAQYELGRSVTLFRVLGDEGGVARSLSYLGVLSLKSGEPGEARHQLETSVALLEKSEDQWSLALALVHLGIVEQEAGDYAEALALASRSVALFRTVGGKWGLALALTCQGNIAYKRRQYAQARLIYEESAQLLDSIGARSLLCWLATSLGHVALNLGEYSQAKRLYERSLPLHHEFGNLYSLAYTLNGLGEVARARGYLQDAAARYRESLALFRTLGELSGAAWALHNLALLALKEKRYAPSATLYKESFQGHTEQHNQLGIASCLLGLAGLALAQETAQHTARRAVTLFSAAQALLDAWDLSLSPADYAEYAPLLAGARRQLTEDEFAEVWETGCRMTAEEAVLCAFDNDGFPPGRSLCRAGARRYAYSPVPVAPIVLTAHGPGRTLWLRPAP